MITITVVFISFWLGFFVAAMLSANRENEEIDRLRKKLGEKYDAI